MKTKEKLRIKAKLHKATQHDVRMKHVKEEAARLISNSERLENLAVAAQHAAAAKIAREEEKRQHQLYLAEQERIGRMHDAARAARRAHIEGQLERMATASADLVDHAAVAAERAERERAAVADAEDRKREEKMAALKEDAVHTKVVLRTQVMARERQKEARKRWEAEVMKEAKIAAAELAAEEAKKTEKKEKTKLQYRAALGKQIMELVERKTAPEQSRTEMMINGSYLKAVQKRVDEARRAMELTAKADEASAGVTASAKAEALKWRQKGYMGIPAPRVELTVKDAAQLGMKRKK
jgi:hypothetical protein